MSSTALAEKPTSIEAAVVERVLIHGDLRQLTPSQKVSYYNHVCESIGLNPLTRPFEYIVLNGKETFYAKRDATDQLRKVHNVSVQIVARETTEGCYVVTARATMPTGRQDESIGAVPIDGLKGEARANALMKGETKAKRRVTLSICGLGMLDETEVESIPHAALPVPLGEGSPDRPSAPNGEGLGTSRKTDDIPGDPFGDALVDVHTGEVAAEPPPGFYYVRNYQFKSPWHEAILANYDNQGGALKVSTKQPIGSRLEEAQNAGIPVSVEVSMKDRRPGEAYVNKIHFLADPGMVL